MNMLTIWMWHWYYQCIYGCVRFPPALHALRVLGQPLRVSCPGSPVRSVSETHSVCFQHLPEPEPCGSRRGLERREGGVPTAVSAGRPWRGRPVSCCALYILLYKVKQPKRGKGFRTSLFADSVIHPEDEPGARRLRGNRTSPPALPLGPLGSVRTVPVGRQPGRPAAARHVGSRGGLVAAERKHRVGGKWLGTRVRGTREYKYTLLSFTCHKGAEPSLQTLGWLSGTRLYAELSHFSQLLNIVMYCCALFLASKWTSFAPFRFIYYAVRCYLKKKILWEKWLIYLHGPAFLLTGFICLCQCKLTKGCSRERANLQIGCLVTNPCVLQMKSVYCLRQSF